MKRIFGGTLVLAVLLCATLPAQGPGTDDKNKALLAEIEAAWKRQEEAFKEVEIEWKEELFMRKGNQSDLAKIIGPEMLGFTSEDIVPATDQRFKITPRVVLRRNEMRIDRDMPVWSPAAKKIVLQSRISSFGNSLNRCYAHKGDPGSSEDYGTASIRSVTRSLEVSDPANRPVLFALRPHAPAFRQVRPEELTITTRSIKIKNRDCIEVKESQNNSASAYSVYYLDSGASYLPRRISMHNAGKVRLLIEVDYRELSLGKFFPAKWHITSLDHLQKINQSHVGEMTSIQETTNEIIFPPLPLGTQVFDDRLQQGKQLYVAGKDTAKHVLKPEELNLAHKDRIQTMETASLTFALWLYIGFALLFLFLGSIYFVIRRSRAKRS